MDNEISPTENVIEEVADTRDEATKALTSHLVGFTLPPETKDVEEVALAAVAPVEFPNDIGETLKLLKEAQALPGGTPTERRIRAIKMDRISAHLHKISQGPEIPFVPAFLKPVANGGHRKRKLEALAAQYPLVGNLLASLTKNAPIKKIVSILALLTFATFAHDKRGG